jgi:hypothetical protein
MFQNIIANTCVEIISASIITIPILICPHILYQMLSYTPHSIVA